MYATDRRTSGICQPTPRATSPTYISPATRNYKICQNESFLKVVSFALQMILTNFHHHVGELRSSTSSEIRRKYGVHCILWLVQLAQQLSWRDLSTSPLCIQSPLRYVGWTYFEKPHTSNSCLLCIFHKQDACDKMYQALPSISIAMLLSQEQLLTNSE